MFDRVTDLSQSLGGSGVDDVDPGSLPDLLGDGEGVAHLLANSGTIEYTEDGRSTTIEPGGDNNAYVLVTDSRVLFMLGDQPDEVEIEFEMADITASHVRSGLLNSKLVVKTETESVVFAPEEGDLEEAEDYLDRVSDSWSDMATAFARARAEMASFEERCAEGREPRENALSARAHLSEARHAATRDDDVPTTKIQARIDEVTTELDRRRVDAWLDRVDVLADEAADAAADGDWDAESVAALVDATTAVERATGAVEDADDPPDDAEDRLAAFSDEVESLAASFLAAVDEEMAAARAADDRPTAADHWGTVADYYRAALDADWDGLAGVSESAIEYELAWVDAKRCHELTTHATELETESDEVDEDDAASDRLEAAEASLERALDVAQTHSLNGAYAPEDLEADLDRIEEKKLERSGWEFGNA